MTIRFEQVCYTYPNSKAGVSDLSLSIERGELLALIGASGSGKTTLLKLLAGFLTPDRGCIYIDGNDVTRLPPRQRELGLVFQTYALFGHMSAWRNVAYPLKVRGIPRMQRRERAAAALRMVNLGSFDDRMPATLSGGQQQRVALARALVFNPKALLLDEPLSALDAALRMAMRDEIIRIQKAAGITTVHVTHDQEEALSIADRVAVLEEGRLVQIDTPRALYDHPATRSVAAFVGQANLWDGRVEDGSRVSCPLGLLRGNLSGRSPGLPVVVLVRPERIVPLCGSPAAAPNRFEGRVIRDRFLGPMRRYDFDVGSAVVTGETTFRGSIDAISIPPESVQLLAP